MPTVGGLHRAVERAVEIEATALQLFVKSARQWSARPLEAQEVTAFRSRAEARGLAAYTLAHASYLINLASPAESLWRRSVEAFGVELDRAERLGIPFLIVHPGAHVGAGERAGLERVARALRRSLRRRGTVCVLLEVTAGQGTHLGHRFEQLGWLLEHAGVERRLGVCFDTCHAFAAGYELGDGRAYRETFAAFDRTIGLEYLRAFHLNDSQYGLASRRDRHAHIGRGRLGLEAFRRVLNDPRFGELPMVLETPKGDDLAEDRLNLRTLRALVRRPRGGR
jgi:deoxyribonuclease-4